MYNERSSYSLVFIISRTTPKKNGECPIFLKININGDKTRFPVKRHIDPEQWDTARARMKGRTKEAEVFNNYLDAIKLRANKLYNELLATNAEVTSQMLKDAILGTNEARPKKPLARPFARLRRTATKAPLAGRAACSKNACTCCPKRSRKDWHAFQLRFTGEVKIGLIVWAAIVIIISYFNFGFTKNTFANKFKPVHGEEVVEGIYKFDFPFLADKRTLEYTIRSFENKHPELEINYLYTGPNELNTKKKTHMLLYVFTEEKPTEAN